MRGPKHFYISLRCPHNAGDLLIKQELCRLVAAYGDLSGYCPQPDFEKLFPASKIHTSKAAFVIKLLRSVFFSSAEVYILLTPGGGGNVFPSLSSTIIRLGMLKACDIFGIKKIQLGVSTEKSLEKYTSYFRLESKCKTWTGYRDTVSIEHARDRKEANYGFFPDLSFPLGDRLKDVRKGNGNRTSILATIRGAMITQNAEYETEMSKVIGALASEFSARMELFYQVDTDEILQNSIATKYSIPLWRNWEFPFPIDDLIEKYSSSRFIVSNRLHALLLGCFCGCIPIPLIGDAENGKIIGIFEDAGLLGLCYHLEKETSSISDHIAQVEQQSDKWLTLIDEWITRSNCDIIRIADNLFSGRPVDNLN